MQQGERVVASGRIGQVQLVRQCGLEKCIDLCITNDCRTEGMFLSPLRRQWNRVKRQITQYLPLLRSAFVFWLPASIFSPQIVATSVITTGTFLEDSLIPLWY